MPDISVSGHLV